MKIAKNAKWQVDRPLCLSMLRSLVGLRAKDITCAPLLVTPQLFASCVPVHSAAFSACCPAACTILRSAADDNNRLTLLPTLMNFSVCRVREHIIDGMCCLAQSLEGMIPELVARVNSGGHVLTKELATFLTQAKETAWVQVLSYSACA